MEYNIHGSNLAVQIERCCVFIYKKKVLYAAYCSQIVKPLVVGTSRLQSDTVEYVYH